MKSKYYLKLTGKYLLRMVTLLIAVSIISFILFYYLTVWEKI